MKTREEIMRWRRIAEQYRDNMKTFMQIRPEGFLVLLDTIDTLTNENKALNTEKVGMIASLAALGTENTALAKRLHVSREALEDAFKRMDDARYLLTEGQPTPHRNWGMLDTTLDKQALAAEELE